MIYGINNIRFYANKKSLCYDTFDSLYSILTRMQFVINFGLLCGTDCDFLELIAEIIKVHPEFSVCFHFHSETLF